MLSEACEVALQADVIADWRIVSFAAAEVG